MGSGDLASSPGMLSFLQRALAVSHSSQCVGPEAECPPGILAITADLGFYSSVLSAAGSCGWSADWGTSMNRGLEICGSKPIQIVIYDQNLPGVDWRDALNCLNAVAEHARILLAAPRVDEDLWRRVLGRRGYDVLVRSASSEQLKRELRFAWLSLRQPATG
jgi:hypothetical protein